ncbi:MULTISPECIES: hypothetical protein [Arthrobacter]|uniref:hypothetical protein n=1 Tax=Arthrobacter TaxID=1663 RepID=UPI001F1E3083|nr:MULTISPECIES: hypothetical protein [Arthrobacter]
MLRRGRLDRQSVSGNCAGIIVQGDRQPRADRPLLLVQDHHVQKGVVHLPLLVRGGGRAAEDQLESVTVGGIATGRESAQARIDAVDDGPHRGVAGCRKASVPGDVAHPTVNVRRRRYGPLQRESLHHFDEFGRGVSSSFVPARRSG